MSSNAKALYELIKKNPENTQSLFRQALQNPTGALQSICDLGKEVGLPVTAQEIKDYLSSLDDGETKQWIIKARGGL